MSHHCHALGCKAACPPRMLMCRACWSQVPPNLQAEVYRTVKLRGPSADRTWAPWWRAQARATAHVAMLKQPNEAARDRYLTRELAFADTLETRGEPKPEAADNDPDQMTNDGDPADE